MVFTILFVSVFKVVDDAMPFALFSPLVSQTPKRIRKKQIQRTTELPNSPRKVPVAKSAEPFDTHVLHPFRRKCLMESWDTSEGPGRADPNGFGPTHPTEQPFFGSSHRRYVQLCR